MPAEEFDVAREMLEEVLGLGHIGRNRRST